ncbi:SDH family Clp fold serine proteinase [Roseateles sp.]|uniref:SDH family Clp fold serine proteinase n=1 Tax=Roseateles sp. TaxID=1971397 RepID=UPI00286AA93B|nr:ATP-dependent Clp protease proteolytic subunit [Roseateles sp.]
MPAWGEVLQEIGQIENGGDPNALDTVRRRYLAQLSAKTGRTTIVYYSAWVSTQQNSPLYSINDDDKVGFMQACHKVEKGAGLDLILHTPGGSVSAAESIVDYLKKIYLGDIRVIVPQIAMSAGTMIACAARSIVMGKQSNLGPIDPHVNGLPAYGVIDEFERAVRESTHSPGAARMWQTIIGKYHPTFLSSCEHAIELSKEIVKRWLEEEMFAAEPKRKSMANKVVAALSSRDHNREHGRHIHAERCIEIGLKVEALEADPVLQDLVLTVHHACTHTLTFGNVAKLIENHLGATYIRRVGVPH